MSFKGITKEKDKLGNSRIIVRFQINNVEYKKNFTKLFGCKNQTQAMIKLAEVKNDLLNGKDPFKEKKATLDEYFNEYCEIKLNTKKWRNITYKLQRRIYEQFVQQEIGWMHFNKITEKDITEMFNKISTYEFKVGTKTNTLNNTTKDLIRRQLSSMFRYYKKLKVLTENVFDEIEVFDISESKDSKMISKKTSEENLEIAIKLYNAIPNYVRTKNKNSQKNIDEVRAFLFMTLMTAHRRGEIIKLERKDYIDDEQKMFSPASITKTKREYEFPIPDECVEYIKSIKSGLLFPNIFDGSVFTIFQRLQEQANIKLREGKKLSIHDTRRLMKNIMTVQCKISSDLAEECLEHELQGVKKHYTDFTYKDKLDAFEKYWSKLRGTDQEENTENEISLDGVSPEIKDAILNLLKLAKK